jgi:hypothetical protein
MIKFHLKFFNSFQDNSSHGVVDFKELSGSENLSGLRDLKRHDNITGLNDLNSLFGLKKLKVLALYIMSDYLGIRNLISLNDLNSLISSKKY